MPGLAQEFLSLLNNPPCEPCAWDIVPGANDPELGFYRRTGEPAHDTGHYDIKDVFQYNPQLLHHLNRDNPAFRDAHQKLLSLCETVYHKCSDAVMERVNEIDYQLALRQKDWHRPPFLDRGRHVLRLLAYRAVCPDSDGIIARAHLDRNLITFALHESHPGLEIQDPLTHEWIPVSSARNQPLIFAGTKLQAHTGGLIKAAKHRVRLADGHADDSVPLRISVIFFGHTDIDVRYIKTH